jgi:RNA polymerase sigma-70 factor (ECF subfamily)
MPKRSPALSTPSISLSATDDQLIDRARQDPCAFAGLYDRYLPSVFRYLYSKVSQPADAEDLTSQVFLAALEAFPKYRHRGYFKTWLLSIARRKAADYYRHSPPEISLDEASGLASANLNPLARAVYSDDLHSLAALVAQLPEEQRELLRLRFAAGLSFPEISRILNRKESAVKMALYRLLERLQIQLEAQDAK